MEKYGFVYIWFDSRRKMYYVGCHWGVETDGYVCSSNRMRDAFRRRPQDFKRRILKSNMPSIQEMFEEEQRYFNMIKSEEIGKRYYNLYVSPREHWSKSDSSRKSVGQKISESPLRRERISKANKGKLRTREQKSAQSFRMSGKTISEDHKKKISERLSGHRVSEKTREKISNAITGLKRGPMSEEQKELRRTPKSEETKLKISQSMKKTLNKRKF